MRTFDKLYGHLPNNVSDGLEISPGQPGKGMWRQENTYKCFHCYSDTKWLDIYAEGTPICSLECRSQWIREWEIAFAPKDGKDILRYHKLGAIVWDNT